MKIQSAFLPMKRAIIFIMASFVFLACEKPNEELGFDQVIGNTTATDSFSIPVTTYTTPVDSILVAFNYEEQVALGGYASRRLVGQNNSHIFGKASAQLVGQMLPQEVNPDFGSNAVVDSVNLFMRYGGSYGDTSQTMSLTVHELSQELNKETRYYSDHEPSLGTQIGGINGFTPQPNTATVVDSEQVGPTLKIPMSAGYFQQKIVDIGDGNASELSSFENFVSYFNGIFIQATSGNTILYFNLRNSLSHLTIYYHNDQGNERFNLNFSQDKNIIPIHFSTFEQDYTNAQFDLQNQDTSNGEPQTYIQAMGGVATALKLDIPNVDSLKRENILINKAYLELHTAVGTGDPAAPSNTLEIRKLQPGGFGDRVIDFQQQTGDGELQLGELRQNKYVFDLTRHIFEVSNTGKNSTLAIIPTNRTTVANRTILRGGNNPAQPARIIVYYTKP